MKNNPAYGFLGRLGSEPLLIAPQFTGMSAVVRSMMEAPEEVEAHLDQFAEAWGDSRAERKPYAFANGVAIIPVHGTLVNRFGWSAWGYTGYDYIRGAFDVALADPSVKGIMLDVDSYGGEVHGCFELSDHIRSSRGKKPVVAMVNANCYSAAYATASAADKIILTPSGGAGSVGVVTMHVDYSKALSDSGISVSFIYAGKHKVDGNPYEPLPDSVRGDIQSRIDATYDKFVALVAKNRRLDEKAVRKTEARCYGAEDAKALGLVDSISAPKEAFAGFANQLSGVTNQEKEFMSIENENAEAEAKAAQEAAAAADLAATEAAAAEAAAAEAAAAEAAAAEEAAASANASTADQAAVERERIKAILALPEAADRAGLASHFALNTQFSVDEAKAALAASPKESKASNGFTAAMDSTPNPGIGTDGGNADGGELTGAARVIANAKAHGSTRF